MTPLRGDGTVCAGLATSEGRASRANPAFCARKRRLFAIGLPRGLSVDRGCPAPNVTLRIQSRHRITGAGLTGAKLTSADLTGADLTAASLEGATLTSAVLEGALFDGATTDETTLCPDGAAGPCC